MWEVIQNRQVLFGNGKAALIPDLVKKATDKKAFVLAFSETAPCVVSILDALKAAGVDCVLDAKNAAYSVFK